jgi:protein SCO1
MAVFRCILVFLSIISISAAPLAATEIPNELEGVGITEHLGDKVSISDLNFRDEAGKPVKLKDYFQKGRPVVLNLVYYECPNLCTFVLNGLVKTLKEMDWVPGKQFEIVTVSIDPHETPALALQKKTAYLEEYGKPEAASGWHFLTGSDASIHTLAQQVGFGFKYLPSDQQFAHAAAIYTLTPEGKISRYLYGIEFKPQDLKLSLLEASNGKIGNVVDRFLLFCYRFDTKTRKYSLYLTKLMQAGGAGTVLVFGGYMAVFWRRQRKGV